MKADFSTWAFRNSRLVYFFIAVLVVGGALSAYRMSKLEDPEIRVKQAMVVTTFPGATAAEVELQIADPLEKSVRTMKNVGDVTTACYNDLCIMTVELNPTVPDAEVEQHWDLLRRRVTAAAASFPEGASTPMVKDDFDTLFGLFYALEGDGMDYRRLSDYAEMVKRELTAVEGVTRIDIYGMPEECIDITMDQSRMDHLGVLPAEVLSTLTGQNKTVYAGYYNTPGERIKIQIEDKFRAVDDIRNLVIQGHDNDQLRLSDIAEVSIGTAEPVRNRLLYDGEPALGLCIGTRSGMDVIKIGNEVNKKLGHLTQTRFPAGLECHEVFYQPSCVAHSLTQFGVNLAESIAIVIIVLMFFMGIRPALIIGISLLVTVLGSFVLLYGLDGTMQRVSLGSFVLAMGILVDNAIVILDGIMVDMRNTDGTRASRMQALTAIGRRTAMPLLGATLIAILAFFPIYLSPDSSGVYVRDLFIVLAVSLLLSWILALVHVPLMASRWLKGSQAKTGSGRESAPYRWLAAVLGFSLRHRVAVMAVMVALLGLSVWGYRFMRQGFFPDMEYSQLYVEYKLPEGVNPKRTEADLREMARVLRHRFPEITAITTSVGATPCRYNLVRTVSTPSLSYGELIIDFDSPRHLEAAVDSMQTLLSEMFTDAYVKVKRYNIMYKKYPIEVQFTGSDPAVLRQLTDTVVTMMKSNPMLSAITTDAEPPVPVLSIGYDQPAARRSGLSRQNIALSMLAANEGIPVSRWYDGLHPMTLYVKMVDDSGRPIEDLENVNIFGTLPRVDGLLTRENLVKMQAGKLDMSSMVAGATEPVPLLQLSDGVDIRWADPVVMRYNGKRAQRAQCSPAPGVTTEAARRSLESMIETIDIPEGYVMDWQGEKYASDRTMKYLFGAVPLAVILMLGILIWLFRGYRKPLIIILCLPFIFIGIVPTMIISGNAFTFLAIVGTLGLTGMMIKNGIVLMDEISLRLDGAVGESDRALIEASKSRLLPVMMASLTTILGMVPLLSDVLFGALAACIMGGLAVGSLTILIVLPVLYSLFYNNSKSR